MKKSLAVFLSLILFVSVYGVSCQPTTAPTNGKKSIVVTYSVLGAAVKELVGDKANVTVSIPNGLDPHEWEPSAKDIEAINKADLVIQNGLGLEGGMEKTLELAKTNGVKFFTASDYITIRHVGAGEGIPAGDPDQAVGASDPHLWMDPIAMKGIMTALAGELKKDFKMDVAAAAQSLNARLDALNSDVGQMVAAVPAENRKLVTGHESMGYFAARYTFTLVGVIIPSLTTQAEVSAADLAALKQIIAESKVKVIFTELGTPPAVADTIARETGIKVVELSTHVVPADGSYFTFMKNVATTVTAALK